MANPNSEIVERYNAAVESNDIDALDALLRDVYQPAKDANGPFEASLEPRPEFREVVEQDIATHNAFEGSRAISWANRIARSKRAIAYRLKTAGPFNGVKIVSEGDSWFQYPLILSDIIDELSTDEDKAIYSVGAAADVLENMVNEREYHDALDETGASILLLSGYGNDMLGQEAMDALLKRHQPGMSASDVIDHNALG